MGFQIQSHSDYLKINLIAAACVVTFMFFFNAPVVHEPAFELSSKGLQEVVVQAGDYQTSYAVKTQIDEPFLVTAIYPQKRRSNPIQDFHSQFVSFSPKATRRYMEKYAGKTHCPASFLNRHADHISLYAANPKIAEKLAGWKQKNGSQVSNWDVVNISGQCLGNRTKIEKNGEDVTDTTRLITIGRKASRDCHMIYVTDIRQTDITIDDYMRGAS